MWFEYDARDATPCGSRTPPTAQKYRNLQRNPAMSLAIFDPDDPERYLEVRGELIETIPDPTGAFYVHLQNRYGDPSDRPPRDKADRVILVMSITKAIAARTQRLEFSVRPRTIPTKVSIRGCDADASQASPIPESGASETGRATTSRREWDRATDGGISATPAPVATSSTAAAS